MNQSQQSQQVSIKKTHTMLSNRPKIHILLSHVDDRMRIQILRMIQQTNERMMGREQALRHLKLKSEQRFGNKWQVVVGDQYKVHFDESLFPHYIRLYTQGLTYTIFSRSHSKNTKQTKITNTNVNITIMNINNNNNNMTKNTNTTTNNSTSINHQNDITGQQHSLTEMQSLNNSNDLSFNN